MKIAEALAERSDLTKKLGELRARIADNMYSSADSPATEDAKTLLAAAHRVAERIELLARCINATNLATPFPGGEDGPATMTDALARRDALAMKHKTVVEALACTGRRGRWYSDNGNAVTVTVDVPALREQADDLAGQLRRLDLVIQQVNWQTEIEL